MKQQLLKTGRFLYGFAIAAAGFHQILLQEFRPEILPGLPVWWHRLMNFPVLTGIALCFTGLIISGLLKWGPARERTTCLYLAFFFLVLFVFCQVPSILFFSSASPARLDSWFAAGEELAYCGGAFVMAGSLNGTWYNNFERWLEKLIPAGPVFFSLLIIMFGSTHFTITSFVSQMVPAWMVIQVPLTYLTGALLIGAGIAIILRIWVKPVALLLALLLFLFFLFFHVPDAIKNPVTGKGDEIVRAIVALMFCGIALVIGASKINQE